MSYNDDYQRQQRDARDRQDRENRDRQDRENLQREMQRQQEARDRQAQDARDRLERENRERAANAQAEQFKKILEDKSRELKSDLEKNARTLREDLGARSDKERLEQRRAFDNKEALRNAEHATQALRNKKQQEQNQQRNAWSPPKGLGASLLHDPHAMAAGIKRVSMPDHGDHVSFVDSHDTPHTLGDLSWDDFELMDADDQAAFTESAHTAAAKTAQEKAEARVRASGLKEAWNHQINLRQDQIKDLSRLFVKVPAVRWITNPGRAAEPLDIAHWLYPLNLAADRPFGNEASAVAAWKCLVDAYYAQMGSVLEKRNGAYRVKDGVRAILKLAASLPESELIHPGVAIARIHTTLDLISLLRHEDVIGFNLKNMSKNMGQTEGSLKQMFEEGSIYQHTYDVCLSMGADALQDAHKAGTQLAESVLLSVHGVVDNRNWQAHWFQKYGRAPTPSEALRIMDAESSLLTDEDFEAHKKQTEEAQRVKEAHAAHIKEHAAQVQRKEAARLKRAEITSRSLRVVKKIILYPIYLVGFCVLSFLLAFFIEKMTVSKYPDGGFSQFAAAQIFPASTLSPPSAFLSPSQMGQTLNTRALADAYVKNDLAFTRSGDSRFAQFQASAYVCQVKPECLSLLGRLNTRLPAKNLALALKFLDTKMPNNENAQKDMCLLPLLTNPKRSSIEEAKKSCQVAVDKNPNSVAAQALLEAINASWWTQAVHELNLDAGSMTRAVLSKIILRLGL